MITALASLFGFLSSLLPELVAVYKDRADREHELKILSLQLEQQREGHTARLEEIRALGEATTSRALYKTWYSGIPWVDALSGTVRPVIAYAFFLLYAAVKAAQMQSGLPWLLWTEEDQAIFAGIISFYYGQRAFGKVRR